MTLPLFAAGFLAVVVSAVAAPPAIESFEYEPGFLLNLTRAEKGWTSGWQTADASDKVPNKFTIEERSLESRAFGAHGLKPAGNHLFSWDANETIQITRGLPRPIEWHTDHVHYVSFLATWSGNHQGAARLQIRLGEQRPDGVFVETGDFVGFRDNGVRDEMILTVGNQKIRTVGKTPLLAGKVYFVVARITTVHGGGLDEVAAVVYPADSAVPSAEPAEWEAAAALARYGKATTLQLDCRLYLPTRTMSFDELRVGDSWAAVTAKTD